jgi:hypothetical protein
VFTYFGFWFEIFILALIPYPRLTNIFQGKFTMATVNWMDPGSFIQPPGSMMVETPYLFSDIMLSLMVFRLYFILQAALVLSPIEKLYARRICFQKGVEVDIWF